jgi:hypothetical protein
MPRVATKLTSAAKGGFVARKVIPLDVRDAYAKLYEPRIASINSYLHRLFAVSGMFLKSRA